MRTLRTPLTVLALVGLIAISGCGGDDSGTSSTASTSSEQLSADDYGQQLTAALVPLFTSLQGLQSFDPQNPEDFGTQIQPTEDSFAKAIDEVNALQPPDEAQDGQDQLVAALEDFSSKLTDLSNSVEAGDIWM